MPPLAFGVAAAMAGLLFWAALEKMRSLSSIAGALHQLGCPERMSVPAALLLMGVELCVAIGLIHDWSSAWVQAGVAFLATGFAAAGLLASRAKEPIRCNCFGSNGSTALGMRQVAALPLWLCGMLILRSGTPAPSLELTALTGAAIAILLAASRVPGVVAARRVARSDRLSASETYQWLG